MKKREFSKTEKTVIYNRFPEWLIKTYQYVKNNKNIELKFLYVEKIPGKESRGKYLFLLDYIKNVFPKLAIYIINYNTKRSCQNELLKELNNVIHMKLNYKRCIEFIYNHLVVLERKHANRLEIEDILNTTDYKKYIIAYSQVKSKIKIINKERGKGNALTNEEEKILFHNKELDIINYVGSLIDKKPLTWEEVERKREEYKLLRDGDKKTTKYYIEEINRLQNIITELGGNY